MEQYNNTKLWKRSCLIRDWTQEKTSKRIGTVQGLNWERIGSKQSSLFCRDPEPKEKRWSTGSIRILQGSQKAKEENKGTEGTGEGETWAH